MKEFTTSQLIERSIFKKYRKELWSPFLTAINEYQLIKEGDKICICISGGKDSMCLAKMLQILQRHSNIKFDLVYLIMDPGYNENIKRQVIANAELLEIPYVLYETNIFKAAITCNKDKPCYICARMRRGHLYNKAKELGCNKIALGHHLNDVIETTLMSMFYSSKLETIVPKALSENFEGMELIRPLYKVYEKDIMAWSRYNNLEFIQCACSFTERKDIDSKRQEIKELIKELRKSNPEIENNIFKSLHAVHIKCFPGISLYDGHHSFLEYYDDADNNIANPYHKKKQN